MLHVTDKRTMFGFAKTNFTCPKEECVRLYSLHFYTRIVLLVLSHRLRTGSRRTPAKFLSKNPTSPRERNLEYRAALHLHAKIQNYSNQTIIKQACTRALMTTDGE